MPVLSENNVFLPERQVKDVPDYSLNATVAKARTLYGKRLSVDDYKELLKKTSISEIADYLKRETHFSECMSNIDINTVHRGYLEEILNRETLEEYARLCKFQNLASIDFFNYRVIINEISAIVRCVTFINAGRSEEFLNTIPTYLIQHASFDMMKLAESRTYGEMLEALRKTPYYEILKNEKIDEDGNYDCTGIDTKLRAYYVNWVTTAVSKNFHGKDKKELLDIINILYDLTNVYNAFRFKAFSCAGEDEISEHLLPVRSRMSPMKKKELLEAENAEAYVEALSDTGFGRQMSEANPEMNRMTLQYDILRLKSKYAKLYLRRTTSPAVSIYTILFLLSAEVKNITTIIEGVRYGVPQQEIEKLLIIV